MKIQALDIRMGDRIVAYCNNMRQACTVIRVVNADQDNITLTVTTSGHNRSSVLRVVRFRRDAVVDLAV
jgi:hypothetical protein